MLRKLFTLAALTITYIGQSQTMYPGGISGCIARWPFSSGDTPTGILTDVSGNGNNGVPSNVLPTKDWRGHPYSAALFNGSTSYGQVPDAALLRVSNFSSIGFVRFDSFYTGSCQTSMLFTKGGDEGPGFYCISIGDNIYDHSCGTYSPANFCRSDDMPNTTSAPYTTPIKLGTWYFMANTYNGTTYTTYQAEMDSTNKLTTIPVLYSASVTSPLSVNYKDLYIGSGIPTSGYPYFLHGALDELIIFNRALSASEITQVYAYLFGSNMSVTTSVPSQAVGSVTADVINGNLHFESKDGRNIGDVMLTNVQGQMVYAKHIDASVSDLDLSAYPKGMYFARVSHNGTLATLKISNL